MPVLPRLLLFVRRAHLYLGLFLFPWAVLYGVSAFLFNHPAAVPDQPTVQFGKDTLAGTKMESLPPPRELAAQVVTKLNERHRPVVPFSLGTGDVKYAGEFAFATVKGDGQTTSVLLAVNGTGGTVRAGPPPKVPPPKPPFAVGPTPAAPSPFESVFPNGEPLAARIKASIPDILTRTHFPHGDVTVTSIPDLVFPVEAGGTTWTATYNPLTGAVGGAPAEPPPAVGWRQFVLHLHKQHGYPGEPTARFGWAVIVDVMAWVLVFWGLSGLVMWWQLKATRRAGAVVLALSAVAATGMGFAMYAAVSS